MNLSRCEFLLATFWLPSRPGCAHTRAYATLGSTSPASSEVCQPHSVFSLILLLRLLLFTVSPTWLMLNCYLLHLPSSSQIFPSFFPLLKWLNGSLDFFYGANHYLPHCAFVLSYLPQPRLSPHTTARQVRRCLSDTFSSLSTPRRVSDWDFQGLRVTHLGQFELNTQYRDYKNL